MKINEKSQSFFLPFLGGFAGIWFGYLYSLIFDADTTGTNYALIIGCVVGVIIGAFATKLVKAKLPIFPKSQKKEMNLFWIYNRRRKGYLFFAVIIPIIVLSTVTIGPYIFAINKMDIDLPVDKGPFIFGGFAIFILFVIIPLLFFKQKEVPLYKESFYSTSEGLTLESLELFNSNKIKYFLKSFWEILRNIFKGSFLLVLPAAIFGSVVFAIACTLFLIWVVAIVIYGIMRGIAALLGKTIFWSSLLVAIIVVFYSWNQYSGFIVNPIYAVLLALITGIFAGVIHRYLVHPVCSWITKQVSSLEDDFSLSRMKDTFFQATFTSTVSLFWDSAWELAEDVYVRKVFKNWDEIKN